MLRKQNMDRTLLVAALLCAAISVGLLTSAPGGARDLGSRIMKSAFVDPASFQLRACALAPTMLSYGLTDPGKVTPAMNDAISYP